jgi:hypothetical protein
MNGDVAGDLPTLRANLQAEVDACGGQLPDLLGKTQAAIEQARQTGNKPLRDQLLEFLDDVEFASHQYDRALIRTIDDSEELADATKGLKAANLSIKDIIDGTKKLADALGTYTAVVTTITDIGSKVLKA